MNNSRIMTYFKGVPRENLSKEETIELVKKAQKGDIESRDKVIFNHISLIASIVKKYNNLGVENDELVDEGILGLIDAIYRFEPERGYAFTTFAYYYILDRVNRCIEKLYYQRSGDYKYDKFKKAFLIENNRPPTMAEMAEHFNLTEKQMINKERKRIRVESYNKIIQFDDTGTKKDKEQQFIEAFNCKEESISDELERDELIKILNKALESLPEEEQYIVKKLNGFFDGKKHTKAELMREFDYPYAKLNRIYKEGLEEIRKQLKKQGYDKTSLGLFD